MRRMIASVLAAILLITAQSLTPFPATAQTAVGSAPPEALSAAFAELKAGHYAQAEADYGRLLKQHPRDPDVMVGLAHTELLRGRPDEAYSRLQVLSTLYPDHAGVYFLLGQLFQEAGMAQPAASSLIRAVVLNPSSQTFRLALARSLVETGQLYVAASQYGKLLEQMEQQNHRPDPAVVYELADVTTRLEMTEDAARLYRLLLTLETEGPRAAIARQRLGLEPPLPPEPEVDGAP